MSDWFALSLFLSVSAAALFSFIAVVSWSDARRQERETYYRTEAAKKIAETSGPSAALAIEYLTTEQKMADARRGDGVRLGGLVLSAVGASLMLFLRAVVPVPGVYLVGLLPLSIGLVLLASAFLPSPKR
jgi:uncharacterized membrane protein